MFNTKVSILYYICLNIFNIDVNSFGESLDDSEKYSDPSEKCSDHSEKCLDDTYQLGIKLFVHRSIVLYKSNPLCKTTGRN